MGVVAVVALLLFGTLGARLYFLQVMSVQEKLELVAGNSERTVITEAPRGEIFDASGKLLAGRRESLVVTLDWTVLREAGGETRTEVFEELADELSTAGLKTKASQLDRTYERAVNGTLKPVVIADDIGEELWVRLSEGNLTGISVERQWVRTYPYGTIAAHILGYTGSVRSPEQADELNAETDKTYFPGDEIGIAGLEKLYEERLRGVPEVRRVEVDAQNRVVRTIEVVQPAIPGQDLVLTVDIDVQYAAEQILIDELEQARFRENSDDSLPHVADAGSLVAVDVENGSVVAIASYPAFDPADFTFGISSTLWNELSNRPDVPLLDRTIRGAYPAASTFKPFVAFAAMEAGVRSEGFWWDDEGTYTLESCLDEEGAGCVFRNAGSAVLGPVDLRYALERSSDTYFYSIGEAFWINQSQYGRTGIQDMALRFGFGQRTGLGLPAESPGRVPTPENRIETFGEDAKWFPGDNVITAIGQGDVLITPLQLANAYATLATQGERFQLNLVRGFLNEDGELDEVAPVQVADEQLDPQQWQAVHDGLLAVVDPSRGSGRGTALRAFQGFPLSSYPIAGKTGTAEVDDKADFSLFAGYGPANAPKYSVAAVLEQSGFGGEAAAPAVRRFFEHLAGITPVPEAPLAGERELAIFGISEQSTVLADDVDPFGSLVAPRAQSVPQSEAVDPAAADDEESSE